MGYRDMAEITIGPPDSDVRIDWDAVRDVVAQGGLFGLAAALGAPGAGGSLTALLGSVPSLLKVDTPEHSQAYELVMLCFAAALDRVRPWNDHKESVNEKARKAKTRAAAKGALAAIKPTLRSGSYTLTPDFFARQPISLPLYKEVRDKIVVALAPLWPKGTPVGPKLDTAFNCALYDCAIARPEVVERLRNLVLSPGLEAQRHESDWEAYKQILIQEFRVKPVFGQEERRIALWDLYVRLRATWDERPTTRDGETDRDRGTTVRYLVDLHGDMEDWLKAQDPHRCIRLLRGGPGSGKSSFVKAFAADLAKGLQGSEIGWRPLVVELQKLLGRGNTPVRDRSHGWLRRGIDALLVGNGRPFDISPLDRDHQDSLRPLVILLDGLDELAVPGSPGAQRVAEDVWDEVDALLTNLNPGNGPARALALITGREAIIAAAMTSRQARELPQQDALAVVGLHAIDLEHPTNPEVLELVSEGDVVTTDQRKDWWELFAAATGASATPPPVFQADRQPLGTLTDEPLLCYLLALTGKAEESRTRDTTRRTEIYDALIGEVWDRRWGPAGSPAKGLTPDQLADKRRVGPLSFFKRKEDFQHVLEAIALAAWRDGKGRIASAEGFATAVRDMRLTTIWKNFQDKFKEKEADTTTPNSSYTTLALTFFFRSSGNEAGFEFAHRSFGEYLAACAVQREARTLIEKMAQDKHVEELARWLRVTGGSELTSAMVDYLFELMEAEPLDDLENLHHALHTAMTLVLRDGLPVTIGSDETYRQAETQQRNAEGCLLVCLSAVSHALWQQDRSFAPRRLFAEEDLEGARQLLERLRLAGFRIPAYRRFSALNFAGQRLELLVLTNEVKILWPGSTLTIRRSDLPFDLKGANLAHAFLFGARLASVNLAGANLAGARLEGAYLEGANLRGARLFGAQLEGANLTGTHLEGANLERANLRYAKGLTQDQIESAKGNSSTWLPNGLARPAHWPDDDGDDHLVILATEQKD